MMNQKERNFTAITISLFAHFFLLQGVWSFSKTVIAPAVSPVVLELSQSAINNTTEDEGLALVDNPFNNPDNAMLNQQRIMRQQFLEEVTMTIHQNRLSLGNYSLIGVAWYSFTIDEEGYFKNIKMSKTSSRRELDEDAYQAVILSSGKIKRPSILGEEDMTILIPIKYQYSLR